MAISAPKLTRIRPLVTQVRGAVNSHRFLSWLLGLSMLHWTFVGFFRAAPIEQATLVRWTILLVNTTVAVLFLTRLPARQETNLFAAALCLPSLVLSGLALALSPSPHQWPLAAGAVFAAGGIWTTASLFTLGRSFAILPALRRVVAGGPYRLMRHPVYAGEFAMLAACLLAAPTWLGMAVLIASLPAIAVRIQLEEQLLSRDTAYQHYASTVTWRLVPGLW